MATKQPKYSWETEFDTAHNTMTHTFSDRVQVVANIKNGEVLAKVDGNTVNAYYNIGSPKEYEALLLACEDYAYQLQRRDRRKALLGKIALYAVMAIIILMFFALCGDNDEWTLGQFFMQKATCFAIMGACIYSIKRVPFLAAAQKHMDAELKEV